MLQYQRNTTIVGDLLNQLALGTMTTPHSRTSEPNKRAKQNDSKSLGSLSLDVTLPLSPTSGADVSWSSSEGSTYYSDAEVQVSTLKSQGEIEGGLLDCEDTIEPSTLSEMNAARSSERLKQVSSSEGYRFRTDGPFPRNSPRESKHASYIINYQNAKEVKFDLDNGRNNLSPAMDQHRRMPSSKRRTSQSVWMNVLENVDFYPELHTARSKGDMSEVHFLSKEDTHEVFSKRSIPIEITSNFTTDNDLSCVSSTLVGSTSWSSDSEHAVHKNYQSCQESAVESSSKKHVGQVECSKQDIPSTPSQNEDDFISDTSIRIFDQVTVSSLESASAFDVVILHSSQSDREASSEKAIFADGGGKWNNRNSSVKIRKTQKSGTDDTRQPRAQAIHTTPLQNALPREEVRAASTDERIKLLKEKIKMMQEAAQMHQSQRTQGSTMARGGQLSSTTGSTTTSSGKEESSTSLSPSTLTGDSSTQKESGRSSCASPKIQTAERSVKNSSSQSRISMVPSRKKQNSSRVHKELTPTRAEKENVETLTPLHLGLRQNDVSLQQSVTRTGFGFSNSSRVSSGNQGPQLTPTVPLEIPVLEMEEISLFGYEEKPIAQRSLETGHVLMRHDIEVGMNPERADRNEQKHHEHHSQRFESNYHTKASDLVQELERLLVVGWRKATDLYESVSQYLNVVKRNFRARPKNEQIVLALIVVGAFLLFILLIALATTKG